MYLPPRIEMVPPWMTQAHDDVVKWKHFSRYWPFVRGIHRSNYHHKGQWRGVLMFSLICAWTNGWANHWDAGDLRRHRAHHDVPTINQFYTFNILAIDDSVTHKIKTSAAMILASFARNNLGPERWCGSEKRGCPMWKPINDCLNQWWAALHWNSKAMMITCGPFY